MMEPLRLTSSRSDTALEFGDIEGDTFRVSVISRDHSATLRVDGFMYSEPVGLAALFAGAAAEWRGWAGEKVWESLCGEFRIALTTDRLGHVTVSVRLRDERGAGDPWQLEATISLDAGQLEGVAQGAARLWHRSA